MSAHTPQAPILLVEDDTDIRDTVASILEMEGYVVQSAADGRLALSLFDRTRPALVLLDMMMPSMNGRQFMRELAKRPADRQAPVVLLSAGNDLPLIAAEIGAVDSLRKPISLQQLLAVVKKNYETSPSDR